MDANKYVYRESMLTAGFENCWYGTSCILLYPGALQCAYFHRGGYGAHRTTRAFQDTLSPREVNFFSIMNKPALYMTGNDLQRCAVRVLSDEFANEIGKMSGRCLDVGSGPGDTVVDFILPKLNPKASLVCSDISEKMVNFGREQYKSNERVSYIELDIETPNLPNDLVEHFDHLTSFYCIHWCEDMRLVFGNIFNLLRPSGTAFLSFVANHSIYDAYPVLAAMPQYQSYMKDVDRYVPAFQHVEHRCETLQALVSDIGFETHHCSLRELTHIFRTPDTLEKFALALNPFIVRMPAELKEAYRKDLAKELTRLNFKLNKNVKNESEYSIPSIYYIFIVYLKKPATM